MRMIRIVTAIAAAASVVALAGCSVSVGGKSVDKNDVANEISQKLTEQVGKQPDKVECPGNLPAKVGATLVCTLTDGTTQYDVHVDVTGVDGDKALFDIKVDDNPKS
ncbi:DUF4333 domain-containing protein [Nocardia stercoris]|uniref:DUF4333 domain-containing protein n=1 Tax=Nocardia stercoris TaxID=2483361 RepID=A0A3M2LFH0_9NOCA|nr:DUF4333 domain-containing protein [Nocardia stercoris]RMI35560.1 DUF4333 domain-containing protein [Nocardia stercoris]